MIAGPRARGAIVRLVAATVLLVAAPALAEPVRLLVKLEAGSEGDSNVHRTVESKDTPAVAAAGGRIGARLALGWRPRRGHTLRLSAFAIGRGFASPDEASQEDVAVVSADGRYDVEPATRPFVVGVRGTYYDTIERGSVTAGRSLDHDFRTGDGTVELALRGDRGDAVTVIAGYRLFQYKPNPDFDFGGEHVGLSYARRFVLGKDEDEDAPTLDLEASYTLARRRYRGAAISDACPGAIDPSCLMPTTFSRSDLFHAAGLQATYTGSRIYSLRYELHVDDSNSFGESLVRHRFEASATTELLWDVYLNAKVVVQFEHYLDPVLLAGDVGTFVSIEDESRNALILHLTRDVGESWTVEARYAFYANAFATQEERFRRQTIYLGVVYAWKAAGY